MCARFQMSKDLLPHWPIKSIGLTFPQAGPSPVLTGLHAQGLSRTLVDRPMYWTVYWTSVRLQPDLIFPYELRRDLDIRVLVVIGIK